MVSGQRLTGLTVIGIFQVNLIPDDKLAEFPPYDLYPTQIDWVPKSGVLSSAKTASVDKGRLMATQVAESIAAAIRTSFADRPQSIAPKFDSPETLPAWMVSVS